VKLLGSDTVIRNIVAELHLDDRPVLVSGDPVQLQQVVLNLLLNAMEAMADSPVADRRLYIRTDASDPRAVLVLVADAGPGLPDGAEELVFEPFYTTKAAGMGMGLAIAKSMIEAHGGKIWAENAAPRGAAFRFCLPRVDAEPA
jgi:signal transduction histidine kinase